MRETRKICTGVDKLSKMQEKINHLFYINDTKLQSRNLSKRINTWDVHLERYSRPFLRWTKEKLQQIDQRTRKSMTIHKALNPRDDVDSLYVSRKGGRRFASIENNVDVDIVNIYSKPHNQGSRATQLDAV